MSSPTQTFEELEAIRVRLVRAQREESLAVRKLNALTRTSRANRLTFEQLLVEARVARERAVAAYEEWAMAVEKFHKAHPPAGEATRGEGSSDS